MATRKPPVPTYIAPCARCPLPRLHPPHPPAPLSGTPTANVAARKPSMSFSVPHAPEFLAAFASAPPSQRPVAAPPLQTWPCRSPLHPRTLPPAPGAPCRVCIGPALSAPCGGPSSANVATRKPPVPTYITPCALLHVPCARFPLPRLHPPHPLSANTTPLQMQTWRQNPQKQQNFHVKQH